jgi:hypothetical protein
VPLGGLADAELCEDRHLGETPAGDSQDAIAWFRNMIALYVLHRQGHLVQLSWIEDKLVQMQLDYKVVDRTDLTGGAYVELMNRGLVPKNYSIHKAQEVAHTKYQDMGTITDLVFNTVTHMDMLKRIDTEREKPISMVITEGTLLTSNFAMRVKQLITEGTPCDWQVINLKAKVPVGKCVSEHLYRVVPDGNEPEDRCREGSNLGMSAMLYLTDAVQGLRSRLESVVWDDKRPQCLQMDAALASISDKVSYYAVPWLQTPGLVQADAFSTWRSQKKVKNAAECTSLHGGFSKYYPCNCGENVCMTNELCYVKKSECRFPPTTTTVTTTKTTTSKTTTTKTSTTTTTTTTTNTQSSTTTTTSTTVTTSTKTNTKTTSTSTTATHTRSTTTKTTESVTGTQTATTKTTTPATTSTGTATTKTTTPATTSTRTATTKTTTAGSTITRTTTSHATVKAETATHDGGGISGFIGSLNLGGDKEKHASTTAKKSTSTTAKKSTSTTSKKSTTTKSTIKTTTTLDGPLGGEFPNMDRIL